jgi:lysophospholipase L1-like esterase
MSKWIRGWVFLLLAFISAAAWAQPTSEQKIPPYAVTSLETAAGITASQLNLLWPPYEARRYGVDMTGATDSTSALTLAHSTCAVINYPSGTVKYSTFTLPCGGGINGAGEYSTIFSTTETGTANSITLSTSAFAPIFKNFTMQLATTKSGGYAIAFSPATSEIQNAEIYRVFFNLYPNAVDFVAASGWQMIACDVYGYTGTGVLINNTNNSDSGDSSITVTNFNSPGNNAAIAVQQLASGGLRLTSDKFNNGGYGYLLNMGGTTSTGDILIGNNSFENQYVAGIEMQRGSGTATFKNAEITGNQFQVNSSSGTSSAIYIADTSGFFSNVSITGNVAKNYNTGSASTIYVDYVNSGNISGNTLLGNGGTSIPITLGPHNTNFIRGQNQASAFGSYNYADINAATAPITLAAITTPLEIYGSGSLATVASIPVPLDLLQRSGVIDATLLVNHAGANGGTGVQLMLGGNVVSQWYPSTTQLGMSFKTQIVITPDLVSGINNGSSAASQIYVQSQNPTVTTPFLTSTTANYGFVGLSLTGTPTLNVNLQAAVGDTITLDGAFFTYHQNSGASFANANAVATWGDSLTAGVGSSNSELTSYPGKLFSTGSNVGRVVYNGGIAGQTSSQINTRAVQDNVRNKWTTIYWYGRNDCCTSGFQSTVLSALGTSIAHLTHTRYLVLSVMNEANEGTGSGNLTNILAANAALAAAYPNNYLDIRTILSTSAINTVPIVNRRVTASTTATYSNGATSFTVASATGITNGMYVTDTTGTNIPDQTTITISGTTVTLSAATTGSATSGTVNFVSPTEVHLNDAGYAIVYSNVSSFLAGKSW